VAIYIPNDIASIGLHSHNLLVHLIPELVRCNRADLRPVDLNEDEQEHYMTNLKKTAQERRCSWPPYLCLFLELTALTQQSS
jgi:hypothetical protein